MNYYYDILLNFDDNFLMFYEWDENDPIEFIKKIPLFHIDNKTFIDLLDNKIIINDDFLSNILNKTKMKQSFIKYACIFGDGKNSIALEFNDDGKVISKSSILLEDELNINEFMYNIELSKLSYEIIEKDKRRIDTRKDEKIKKLLNLEINRMYKNKNYSKLKYIYLEWFNILSDDYDLMYNNMQEKLKNKLSKKEYEIYDLIKISFSV